MSHHPYDVAGHLPGDMSVAEAADDKWIKDEVQRARDRASKLPRGARPVVTRPVVASRAEKRPNAAAHQAGDTSPAEAGDPCAEVRHRGDAISALCWELRQGADPVETAQAIGAHAANMAVHYDYLRAAAHPAEVIPGNRGRAIETIAWVVRPNVDPNVPDADPEQIASDALDDLASAGFRLMEGWLSGEHGQPAAAPGQGRERELADLADLIASSLANVDGATTHDAAQLDYGRDHLATLAARLRALADGDQEGQS